MRGHAPLTRAFDGMRHEGPQRRDGAAPALGEGKPLRRWDAARCKAALSQLHTVKAV